LKNCRVLSPTPAYRFIQQGIKYRPDVYKAIKAETDSKGTTSGILKAGNPEAILDEMICFVRTAWDEIHT